MLGLAHAAERAVVAHDERNLAAGLLLERTAISGIEIPTIEGDRQVGRMGEHTVALVGARDGQADTLHLFPAQLVGGQVAVDGLDPACHHRARSLLRVGRVLQELARDGLAV
jgi:hypothetical protein